MKMAKLIDENKINSFLGEEYLFTTKGITGMTMMLGANRLTNAKNTERNPGGNICGSNAKIYALIEKRNKHA